MSGRVDFSLLRVSWFLFAGVVALGPLLIFVESRAKYAITWRAANPQNFDPQPFNALDRLKFAGVLVYTLAMRPRNLIYARDTDSSDPKATWLNARMIQKLHLVWDWALALELLVWACFVAALAVLVLAVSP